jgi:hypothetical protein
MVGKKQGDEDGVNWSKWREALASDFERLLCLARDAAAARWRNKGNYVSSDPG